MLSVLLPNLDLAIAGIILLICVLVFFLVHIHALPVKTVPFVIASLVALAGFEIFKTYRANKLNQQIDDQKKQLDERRAQLERMKNELTISNQQYDEARTKLDEYEASFRKTTALLEEEDNTRRKEIENMSLDDVLKTLGGGKPIPLASTSVAPAGGVP